MVWMLVAHEFYNARNGATVLLCSLILSVRSKVVKSYLAVTGVVAGVLALSVNLESSADGAFI